MLMLGFEGTPAETGVFLFCAALCLFGAIGVVGFRNPVHAALSLVTTLFAIAVLFIAQNADFLAVVQIIVYAGAIVVLFLFVIMLLGVDKVENLRLEPLRGQRVAAAVLGLAVLGIVGGAIVAADNPTTGRLQQGGPATSEIRLDGLPSADPQWVLQVAPGEFVVAPNAPVYDQEQGELIDPVSGSPRGPADRLFVPGLNAFVSVEDGTLVDGLNRVITNDEPNVERLGRSLFTDFVFAFEATAVLLVIAVVGAVVLAKRPPRPEDMIDEGPVSGGPAGDAEAES